MVGALQLEPGYQVAAIWELQLSSSFLSTCSALFSSPTSHLASSILATHKTPAHIPPLPYSQGWTVVVKSWCQTDWTYPVCLVHNNVQTDWNTQFVWCTIMYRQTEHTQFVWCTIIFRQTDHTQFVWCTITFRQTDHTQFVSLHHLMFCNYQCHCYGSVFSFDSFWLSLHCCQSLLYPFSFCACSKY